MIDLEALIERVEYRNHRFVVQPMTRPGVGMASYKVIIVFCDENAEDPRLPAKEYEWNVHVPNDALESEDACLRWLFREIVLNEVHEAQEFFKVDGQMPYDPHSFGLQPRAEVTWKEGGL